MFRSVALGILLLVPGMVAAVGTGDIIVTSALNEPLIARIPLHSLEEGELSELEVALADEEAYQSLGLERNAFLLSLDMRITEGAGGKPSILISSQRAARDPYISFLLELSGSHGRILREYTVLLDPAPYRADAQAVATPAPSQPAVASAVDDAPAVKPAAAAPTATESAPAPAESSRTYGPIKAGETLWRVALAVRPDAQVTMDQVMWGLFSANPEQFSGNLNLLNKGAVLRVPSRQAMINVSPAEASALVAEEAAAHAATLARQGAAEAASSEPAEPEVEVVEAEPLPTPAPTPKAIDVAEPTPAPELPSLAEPEEPVQLVDEPAEPEPELEPLPTDDAALAGDDLPDLPALPLDDEGPTESGLDQAELSEEEDALRRLQELAGQLDDADETQAQATTAAPESAEQEQAAPAEPSAPQAEGESDGGGLMTLLLGVLGALVVIGGVLFALARRGRKQAADESADDAADFGLDSVSSARPVEPSAIDDDATQIAPDSAAGLSQDTTEFAAPPQGDADATQIQPRAEMAEPLDDDNLKTAEFDTSELQGDFGATQTMERPPEFAAPEDTADLDGEVDFDDAANATLDLGSETVSLELNEDPLSEADFHLAYGLYDEAALLLSQAIENDPERIELREKLAETYFAAGDAENFKATAQALKGQDPGDGVWQKVAIMGQQLLPDDPLFQGDLGSGDIDFGFDEDDGGGLDMDFGDDNVGAEDLEPTSQDDDDDATRIQPPPEDDNLLEFELPEMEDATVVKNDEPDAPTQDDSGLSFDLEGATDATPQEPAEASDQAAAEPDLGLDDLGADLGELELGTQSEEEIGDLPDIGDDFDLEGLDEFSLDADETASSQADDSTTKNETVADDGGDELSFDVPEETSTPPESDAPSLDFDDDEQTQLRAEPDTVQSNDAAMEFDLEGLDEAPAAESDTPSVEFEAPDLSVSEDAVTDTDTDAGTESLDLGGDDLNLGDDSLDLGSDTFDAEESLQEDGTAEDLGLESLDLGDAAQDFGTDSLDLGSDTFAEDATTDAGSEESDETDEFGLDSLDLGAETDFDLSADAPADDDDATVVRSESDDAFDDLDLSALEDSDDSEISGGDEAGTKLDLARAYVDMGENDMARNLLDEVVNAGNEDQVNEARDLLNKLS